MQVLEKHIEAKAVAWAKRAGIKVKVKMFGEHLDRWFFFPNGHLYIIEFKRPGQVPTPRQQKEIDELKELGFDVEVHDDSDEAITALRKRAMAPAKASPQRA